MIYIIYNRFYDFQKNVITIGGIQTYMQDLIDICREMNYQVCVIQIGDEERNTMINGYTIKQYCITARYKNEALAKRVKSEINNEQDLIIFATDSIAPWNVKFKKSIAIQHGISWDKPSQNSQGLIKSQFIRMKDSYRMVKRLSLIGTVVCVDYNFQNWYRTQVEKVENNLIVIPNYSRVPQENVKPEGIINIIFARRLFWYRGTRVFVSAIKPILDIKKNIHVTVAGNGADEAWMHEQLSEYRNVDFIKYQSDESLEIHKDKHIAIVPTVGSEGTSLSLLEAMAAGCAVVASDVGGITNIILNGFNGCLVKADDSKELEEAIQFLIENKSERERFAHTGYQTVKYGFSYEKWAESWKKVIKSVISG